MKKVISGILGMAIVLSLCAMTAFAAAPGRGPNFVDADGDGICDNCGTAHRHGAECGHDFVDVDGNGICDNCGTAHRHNAGYGHGCHSGHGHGCRGK